MKKRRFCTKKEAIPVVNHRLQLPMIMLALPLRRNRQIRLRWLSINLYGTQKENLAKILNSTLLPEKIPTRCSSTLCQGASINTKPDGFVQSHPATAISKALQGWFQCAQHLYYSAFTLPDSRGIFYENYTIFIYLLRIDKSLVQSYNKAIEKQRPHKTGKAHKILSTGKAVAERNERKTFMVELEPAQLAQAFKKHWTELHSWWKRTYFA